MAKLVRLPQTFDIHVHLRDFRQKHKEDFYSGTCAALAGGITTVFDMPNNDSPISSPELLSEKIKLARQKAVCDFGFYFASDGRNISVFPEIIDQVVGLKLYLNTTTGNLKIEDNDLVEYIFKNWPKKKLIITHAEKEKIDLALSLSAKFGNRLHITHISRRSDLEKIIAAKKDKLPVTCDVTPHHLFLTEKDKKKLGPFVLVKPLLPNESDQNFLWDNLDKIDCLASDHAPHTLAEKNSKKPPFGIPGLETMIPLMFDAVNQKRISLQELIRLISTGPAAIFHIQVDKKSFVEVDMDKEYIIENKNLFTKCRWSPFHGRKIKGKIEKTVIRGTVAFADNQIKVPPGFGRPVFS